MHRTAFFIFFCIGSGLFAFSYLLPTPQKAQKGQVITAKKAFGLRVGEGVSYATTWEYTTSLKRWGFEEGSGGIVVSLELSPEEKCAETALKDFLWRPYEQDVRKALDKLQDQVYFLEVKERQVSVQACGEDGFFYALQTFRQLFKEEKEGIRLVEVSITDFPSFPLRGIFEGGYGIWSLEGRLKVLDWMGSVKLNSYLYGPKSDPKIRRRWREPYSDVELFGFKRALQKAKENHIEMGYTISPPLGMQYSSKSDFKMLLKKVRQLQSLGMRTFVLAFDDTMGILYDPKDRKRFKTLATAETSLANKLFQALRSYDKEATLAFVPEIYAGVHPMEYTRTIAKRLHPEIYIGWTGPEIVAPKIEGQDIEAFVSFYNRMPALGDNWGSLFPLLGRARDLYNYVPQFSVNPYNLQGEVPIAGVGGASEPELMPIEGASAAEFGWNTEAYDPSTVLKTAAHKLFRLDKKLKDRKRIMKAFFVLMTLEYYDISASVISNYKPPFERSLNRFMSGGKETLLKRITELLEMLNDIEEHAQAFEEFAKDPVLGATLARRIRAKQPELEKFKKAVATFKEEVASQDTSKWEAAKKKLLAALRKR